MTPENFCYWLQGYLELSRGSHGGHLDAVQVLMIQDHLNEVFTKVTPNRKAESPFNPQPVNLSTKCVVTC